MSKLNRKIDKKAIKRVYYRVLKCDWKVKVMRDTLCLITPEGKTYYYCDGDFIHED